jgi:hypothetical protein
MSRVGDGRGFFRDGGLATNFDIQFLAGHSIFGGFFEKEAESGLSGCQSG